MCKYCDWESVLERVNEMLDDSDFDFAYDTLSGIGEWIEDNSHATEHQKETVSNIYDSVEQRR